MFAHLIFSRGTTRRVGVFGLANIHNNSTTAVAQAPFTTLIHSKQESAEALTPNKCLWPRFLLNHDEAQDPSKPEREANQRPPREAGRKHRPPSSHYSLQPIWARKLKVSNVQELRDKVIDQQRDLSKIRIPRRAETLQEREHAFQSSAGVKLFEQHDVLQLMAQRFRTGSTPGNRQDQQTLALAIEGGGMRGCVSAGMAAAIGCLGLTDTIDTIYGSSAGSVIGSYIVSRQMCMDVYVDILPAAKSQFVCKRRMAQSFAASFLDVLVNGMRTNTSFPQSLKENPGMNLSFVLDDILGQDRGVRPLDLQKFEQNNAKQPLRVVSSYVDSNGEMKSQCFGTADFFGRNTAVRRTDGSRQGLFACLEASMSVPAATGPPVELQTPNSTDSYFDAFCFEPIPYRSAVEEGATHVLALCSRPEDYQPKTRPGIFEQTIAPLYFHSHGHHKVADYFERGGQLYLYAEDLLTLQEARNKSHDKVLVPPPKVYYGLSERERCQVQREAELRDVFWKKAHLYPIQVPPGTRELSSLEQDRESILRAVRGGFRAAFDTLSPLVGLQPEMMSISGEEAARLVFPDSASNASHLRSDSLQTDDWMLNTKIHVPGEPIVPREFPAGRMQRTMRSLQNVSPDMSISHALLTSLPGFQGGRLQHLAKGLRCGSSMAS